MHQARARRSIALLLGSCLLGSCLPALGCRDQVAKPPPAERARLAVPSTGGAGSDPDQPMQTHVRAQGQLGPGAGTLLIDLAPPAGAKLTLDAPLSVRGSGGIGLGFPRRLSGALGQQGMPLRLPIEVADGATGPASVELSYFWCTEGNEAACRRELALLSIDLDLSGSSAGGEAHLSHRARSAH
jgi:hypothetical protein